MTIKVLVVCNGNRVQADDELQVKQPFIYEQVAALSKYNVESTFFLIKGRGVLGYLGNLCRLRRVVSEVQPDLIHAHYGFSGLLACLQRRVPVVVTFHGSDVNEIKNRFFSFLASRLSSRNIFVNATLSRLLHAHGAPVIPCGVDAQMFQVQSKREAREALGLGYEAKLVLFSSAFDNQIKNVALAKSAVELLPEGVQLLELKNRSRREVALLLNAVDCLVLTSLSEGSPQIEHPCPRAMRAGFEGGQQKGFFWLPRSRPSRSPRTTGCPSPSRPFWNHLGFSRWLFGFGDVHQRPSR